MRCPNCNAEMESGRLNLKGYGGAWPFYAAADVSFNSDVLLQNWCVPVIDWMNKDGTKAPAYRCKVCQLVAFQYVLPATSEEPVVISQVEPVPSPGTV